MEWDDQRILELLKRNPLFAGLSNEELITIADEMELISVPRGDPISLEGEPSMYFWIVLSGRGHTSVRQGEKAVFDQPIREGQTWGEQCVHLGAKNPITVSAISNMLLLCLPRDRLIALFAHIPRLETNFQLQADNTRLQEVSSFPWINPDERIFYITRKHPVFLAYSLALPIMLMFVTICAAIGFFDLMIASTGFLIAVMSAALVSIGWLLWNWIDWSNDYAIVTNQRAVWQERKFGIYDSRHEAPFTSLQAVEVQTTQMGRIIGYGDVVIRMFTGPITLHAIAYPEEVSSWIRQQWLASQVSDRRTEAAAIEQSIRQRLNSPERPQTDIPIIDTNTGLPEDRPISIPGGFLLRVEESGVITYRKHWFILIKKTWKPCLIACLGIGLWFLRLADGFVFIPMSETLLGLTMILLVAFLWWLYQYIDWRNDVYQVTPTQIIDLERTPLGKEEKNSTPLENVLSMEYKRLGLAGLILNFGTVSINVGGTQLTFDHVYNPSRVQEDISRKISERRAARKREQVTEERERVSDWIAAYHRNVRANPGLDS